MANENKRLHHAATVVNYFANWQMAFDPTLANNSWAAGALPMITWQPEGATSASNSKYTLLNIEAGNFDPYITQYAKAVKAYKKPIALRFAHEMNGSWYPWGVLTKGTGNTAAEFVAVWRHVWTIFHNVGATNVIWVWSVNTVQGCCDVSLSSLYPGKNYVNWIGISAYLYSGDTTYAKAFDATLSDLNKVTTSKPLIVTETGIDGVKSPGYKELTSLLDGALATPRMLGVVYFDEQGVRRNWSFDSWPKAVAAAQAILPKFHKAW